MSVPNSNDPIEIWRRNRVMDVTGLAASSLYYAVHHYGFPRPVKLGPRSSGWIASEVQDWLRQRADARGEA